MILNKELRPASSQKDYSIEHTIPYRPSMEEGTNKTNSRMTALTNDVNWSYFNIIILAAIMTILFT